MTELAELLAWHRVYAASRGEPFAGTDFFEVIKRALGSPMAWRDALISERFRDYANAEVAQKTASYFLLKLLPKVKADAEMDQSFDCKIPYCPVVSTRAGDKLVLKFGAQRPVVLWWGEIAKVVIKGTLFGPGDSPLQSVESIKIAFCTAGVADTITVTQAATCACGSSSCATVVAQGLAPHSLLRLLSPTGCTFKYCAQNCQLLGSADKGLTAPLMLDCLWSATKGSLWAALVQVPDAVQHDKSEGLYETAAWLAALGKKVGDQRSVDALAVAAASPAAWFSNKTQPLTKDEAALFYLASVELRWLGSNYETPQSLTHWKSGFHAGVSKTTSPDGRFQVCTPPLGNVDKKEGGVIMIDSKKALLPDDITLTFEVRHFPKRIHFVKCEGTCGKCDQDKLWAVTIQGEPKFWERFDEKDGHVFFGPNCAKSGYRDFGAAKDGENHAMFCSQCWWLFDSIVVEARVPLFPSLRGIFTFPEDWVCSHLEAVANELLPKAKPPQAKVPLKKWERRPLTALQCLHERCNVGRGATHTYKTISALGQHERLRHPTCPACIAQRGNCCHEAGEGPIQIEKRPSVEDTNDRSLKRSRFEVVG
jgi:hypothetical protein